MTNSVNGKSESNQTLSSYINLYISDRSAHWSSKTKAEFTQYFATLLFLLNDKLVASIKRSDCIKCRRQLKSLTPNFTKKKHYLGMSASQIAKTNFSDLSLNDKTVNKYLTYLSSFSKWAIKQGIISSNPAEGLLLSLSKSVSEEREVFSLADIQNIQAKLPRLACEPGEFWIPTIAMYSGMRLDEICQLHKVDIQVIDGFIASMLILREIRG